MAPEHALAHVCMGRVRIQTNRARQGIAECERALALDRNLATAHANIGQGKLFLGRAEETEGHILEALRLSPRDPIAYSWMALVGGAKLHLGKYEESVAWLHRSIQNNRNASIAHFFLAVGLAQLSRIEEARAAIKTGLALNPKFTINRFRAGAESDNLTFLTNASVFMRVCVRPECRSSKCGFRAKFFCYAPSSSSNFLASFRSSVSKPSVNQP